MSAGERISRLVLAKVAPAAGVADGHQPDHAARIGQHLFAQRPGEGAFGQHRLGNPVIAQQIGQVQHLHVGEDARCTAGRGDVDVDRPVGDALKAFRAGRAQLGADEQLDFDGTIRRLFDIVLEHDRPS
jgi:hypothetical protein